MLQLTDVKAVDDAGGAQRALLEDLQCNILSSHDRSNTHYFFLTFSAAKQARDVLSELANGTGVSKALKLESELASRARRRERSSKDESVRFDPVRGFSTSLMLSARCYELVSAKPPADPAFLQGMQGRDEALEGAHKLNDPPHVRRGPGAHALFAVGYDAGAEDWSSLRGAILVWLRERDVAVREEAGYVLRHPSKHYAIEPFGYRDAISQPLFFQEDLDARRKHELDAATVAGGKWSSFAPLSLALVPDPNGKSASPHGTFVAYRKLRQKVDVFYEQAEALAGAVALPRDDVADRLIGRHADGKPLDGDGGPNLNDFAYAHDSKCPLHAHVRKINDRTAWSRPHRIVRRSTVFGPKLCRDKASGRPELPTRAEDGSPGTPDVGLLFFSCQASIVNQFEFAQAQWANATKGGADTVIGQLPPGARHKIALNGSGLTLDYHSVVELLEGEYFFVPSISFLSHL